MSEQLASSISSEEAAFQKYRFRESFFSGLLIDNKVQAEMGAQAFTYVCKDALEESLKPLVSNIPGGHISLLEAKQVEGSEEGKIKFDIRGYSSWTQIARFRMFDKKMDEELDFQGSVENTNEGNGIDFKLTGYPQTISGLDTSNVINKPSFNVPEMIIQEIDDMTSSSDPEFVPDDTVVRIKDGKVEVSAVQFQNISYDTDLTTDGIFKRVSIFLDSHYNGKLILAPEKLEAMYPVTLMAYASQEIESKRSEIRANQRELTYLFMGLLDKADKKSDKFWIGLKVAPTGHLVISFEDKEEREKRRSQIFAGTWKPHLDEDALNSGTSKESTILGPQEIKAKFDDGSIDLSVIAKQFDLSKWQSFNENPELKKSDNEEWRRLDMIYKIFKSRFGFSPGTDSGVLSKVFGETDWNQDVEEAEENFVQFALEQFRGDEIDEQEVLNFSANISKTSGLRGITPKLSPGDFLREFSNSQPWIKNGENGKGDRMKLLMRGKTASEIREMRTSPDSINYELLAQQYDRHEASRLSLITGSMSSEEAELAERYRLILALFGEKCGSGPGSFTFRACGERPSDVKEGGHWDLKQLELAEFMIRYFSGKEKKDDLDDELANWMHLTRSHFVYKD